MFALHIFFLLVAASLASSTEAMGYSEGSKAMTASSLAQFSFAPFELTDVCVACSRRNESASYKCNLKFRIFDPNSVRENPMSSCTCNSTWSWANDTNDCDTTYKVCCRGEDSAFEMRFDYFKNAGNLSLGIGHMYKDDVNFTPPYDHVITFVAPTLLLPAVKHNDTYLRHYSPGPLYSNITSISD